MHPESAILGAFVWPGLFFGGLAGVAAPVIIHLLVRRRLRRVRWAAMDFLMDAQRHSRRRVRLEQLILLLLRCLAALLLAALLARPFALPGGWGSWFGGIQHTERIIVLDDSFSMMRRHHDDSLFEAATRAVTQLVKNFDSDYDSITVLLGSAPEDPLVSSQRLGVEAREALAARVAGLTASQRAVDFHAVLRSVRAQLDGRSDILNATIYVVSDFQRVGWVDREWRGETDPSLHQTSPLAVLDDWAGGSRRLTIRLIDVGADQARNVAVVAVHIAAGPVVADIPYELSVQLANHSQQAVHNVLVRVSADDGTDVESVVSEIGPDETVDHRVKVVHADPGRKTLRVEIDPGASDELGLDNEQFHIVTVEEAVRVLIVNGAPSSDTLLDEVSLLKTALDPRGALSSGNEIVVIGDYELEAAPFADFHVVILANVASPSLVAAQRLGGYVEGGGGVMVFLGDRVNTDDYNRTLGPEGAALLPGVLESVVITSKPVLLVATPATHPVMELLFGADGSLMRHVHFRRFMWCVTADPAAVTGGLSASASPGDGHTAGHPPEMDPTAWSTRPCHPPQVNVLARYATPDREPAIIEGRYGDGSVILFTSTCDRDWNDWASQPSYVVGMLEFVRHASGGAARDRQVTVGSPIELQVDGIRFHTDAYLVSEGSASDAGEPITGVLSESGDSVQFSWGATERAGVYRFQLRPRHEGTPLERAVAVTLDPDESNLRHATEPELHRSLSGLQWAGWAESRAEGAAARGTQATRVDYLTGTDGLDSGSDLAARELWRFVLAALVGVLLIEQTLACWFGRRG